MEENTDAARAETPAPEGRRVFSPVLVLFTVAVVVFVLWFCPWALKKAWERGQQARGTAPAAVE